MRVVCKSALPDANQIEGFGPKYWTKQAFFIRPGNEYDVLGLMFTFDANVWGAAAWVYIADDYDGLVRAPLVLFEVVDRRGSRLWEFDSRESDVIQVAPEPLNRQYFADDLSNNDPVAVADYKKLREQISSENERHDT